MKFERTGKCHTSCLSSTIHNKDSVEIAIRRSFNFDHEGAMGTIHDNHKRNQHKAAKTSTQDDPASRSETQFGTRYMESGMSPANSSAL